jgi:Uma2 family endonuclease
MAPVGVGLAPPDPMHLEGWEEQDEPSATDRHSEEQAYCWTALRSLLEPDGHYVSKDRRLRMDPDDEQDKLLPDLLIARDVLKQQWNVNEYLPWLVGKAPELLAEFLSPGSEGVDQKEKPRRYAELGVQEYFLFDPDGTYGVPRVQGWALRRDGRRETLPRAADGGVASAVLPVTFRPVGGHIAVVDTRTGRVTLRYEEVQALLRRELETRFRAEEAQRQEAEARQQAEQARREAEAEVARLRAELDRLRRGDREHGTG